jgi:hypothetical protein
MMAPHREDREGIWEQRDVTMTIGILWPFAMLLSVLQFQRKYSRTVLYGVNISENRA